MSRHADTIAYAPRGLRREEAARYIGVGASKFDQMVADRQMPKPKKVGGCVIWDRIALDVAFSELPDESSNRIDDILSGRR
ncbi:putative DNA-binding transcriptional regulator AlpA [Rhizobium azooxidifex]|uniref:Putative DNA-binding transcriptional regulator AlpA n=1 Tax=Mycoplana azooxidifex TaxID=1636188 RepID=A0A7W6D9F1_9HYPH|nr:hypothetical protein [Mycoplana azooxidifex]MBB3979090.1 putative DNA-binding transcriptional regulator AlpA [Mycoplana azooxidifex]